MARRAEIRARAVVVVATAGALASVGCVESGDLDPAAARAAAGAASLVCKPPASNEARDVACSRWACAHSELAAAGWDGDSKRCAPGTIDPRARDRALRLINTYRFLAGVLELEPEPRWDPPAQDCALLAHANRRLSHTPAPDWSCWTNRGARASAVSLVANVSAPLAIDPFIEDPDNESTMVHRRWLLSEKIHRIGLGSTSGFSCALVDGREWDGDEVAASNATSGSTNTLRARDATPAWVAWPPPGPVPLDVFRRTKVDTLGWTIQSSSLDLDGARVEVRVAGEVRPLKVSALERTLGSLTAIRFVPDGWSTQPGQRYDVHVSRPPSGGSATTTDKNHVRGEGVLIDFAVTPVSCP